jgi:hypothetical protein
VKDEEAARPAQAYDLGGVSKWFFGVHIHSLYPRAYLSGVYAVVKGHMRLSFACQDGEHWACPSHLGVEGFRYDCHCHFVEPLPDNAAGTVDTPTVHTENCEG